MDLKDFLPQELQQNSSLPESNQSLEVIIEEKIKQGINGLKLIEIVKNRSHCSDSDAILTINSICQKSANSIESMFTEEQLIIMCWELYNRAFKASKIKDALFVLHSIHKLMTIRNLNKKEANSTELPKIKEVEKLEKKINQIKDTTVVTNQNFYDEIQPPESNFDPFQTIDANSRTFVNAKNKMSVSVNGSTVTANRG